jgi:hypothetical protein
MENCLTQIRARKNGLVERKSTQIGAAPFTRVFQPLLMQVQNAGYGDVRRSHKLNRRLIDAKTIL